MYSNATVEWNCIFLLSFSSFIFFFSFSSSFSLFLIQFFIKEWNRVHNYLLALQNLIIYFVYLYTNYGIMCVFLCKPRIKLKAKHHNYKRSCANTNTHCTTFIQMCVCLCGVHNNKIQIEKQHMHKFDDNAAATQPL